MYLLSGQQNEVNGWWLNEMPHLVGMLLDGMHFSHRSVQWFPELCDNGKECGTISLLYNLHVSQCWCVRYVNYSKYPYFCCGVPSSVVLLLYQYLISVCHKILYVYTLGLWRNKLSTTTPGPPSVIGVCISLMVHTSLSPNPWVRSHLFTCLTKIIYDI